MNNLEKNFFLLIEETEVKSKTARESLKEYLRKYLYNNKEEQLLTQIRRFGKANFLQKFYKGDGRKEFFKALDELKKEKVLPEEKIEDFENKYRSISKIRTTQTSEGYNRFLDFLAKIKESGNMEELYKIARKNTLSIEFNLERSQEKRGLERFFSKQEIEKIRSLYPKLHNTSINENNFFNEVEKYLKENYPGEYILEKNKILGEIKYKNNSGKTIISKADADLYLEVPGQKIAVLWDGRFHLEPMRKNNKKDIEQFKKTNEFALKKIEFFNNLGIKIIIVEDPKGYVRTKENELSLPKITASMFIFNLKNGSLRRFFVNEKYKKEINKRINKYT